MMTKIVTGLVLIVLVVVVLAITGHKRVYTELKINSTPQVVWSVLMDNSSYGEWNPFAVKVEGQYGLDAEMIVHGLMPGASKPVVMKVRVKKIEKNILLHQHGGFPGIITYDHRFHLQPQNDGTTLLIQEEDYHGLYVWFWNAKVMQPIYESVNKALANYIKTEQNK